MTDATLPTPRRSGFRFDRYASGFLLLAGIVIYVGILLATSRSSAARLRSASPPSARLS